MTPQSSLKQKHFKSVVMVSFKYIKTTTDMIRFDEEGNPLPCLVQEDTGILYFDAIDKENTTHTYREYEEVVEEA